MQGTNRERSILLRADLGIVLGSWYGECNVNSRKDRNLEQVKRLIHLTQNGKRDKNEGLPDPHSWLIKSLGLQRAPNPACFQQGNVATLYSSQEDSISGKANREMS